MKNNTRAKIIKALKSYNIYKKEIELSKENLQFLEDELNKVKQGKQSIIMSQKQAVPINVKFDYIEMSCVEKEFFKNENVLFAQKEELQEMCNKIISAIRYKQRIIDCIDTATSCLFAKEKYVIELYYTDNLNYSSCDIEKNFNKKFRCNVVIKTLQGLRCRALNKLEKLLKDNYVIQTIGG
jgi:hypothetical protein